MKIFGIGLNKTGSHSLKAALEELGYTVVHHPKISKLFECAEKRDGIVDTPTSKFYQELDELYDDAKFILTIRDESEWINSCRAHWDKYSERPGYGLEIREAIYGIVHFDEDVFKQVYREHVEEVTGYFAGRPGDLLIMNICDGDGYERLCPFLGHDILHQDFPHKYAGDYK